MNRSDITRVIGIDPGVDGGLACWRHDQPIVAFGMPQTEGDLIQLLRTLITSGEIVAYVELVGGFTGEAQPASRMFRFGRSFGFILGALQAMNVSVELIRPQKWRKPLGIGTASACFSRTEWKSKLKAHSQRLYLG